MQHESRDMLPLFQSTALLRQFLPQFAPDKVAPKARHPIARPIRRDLEHSLPSSEFLPPMLDLRFHRFAPYPLLLLGGVIRITHRQLEEHGRTALRVTLVQFQIGRASCREECRSRWSP